MHSQAEQVPIPQGLLWSFHSLSAQQMEVPGDESSQASHAEQELYSQLGLWSRKLASNAYPASHGLVPKIALLDSGCDISHKTFSTVNCPNVKDWVFESFVTDDPLDKHDEDGHGTAIASILVQTCPVAVLLVGKVYVSRASVTMPGVLAKAIDWARLQGAHVISLSLGGPSPADSVFQALCRASEAGISIVCAAGNSGRTGHCNILYPAAFGLAVTVGGHAAYGVPAPFSSVGQAVDVLAPAVNVPAAAPGPLRALMRATRRAVVVVVNRVEKLCADLQLMMGSGSETKRAQMAPVDVTDISSHLEICGQSLVDVSLTALSLAVEFVEADMDSDEQLQRLAKLLGGKFFPLAANNSAASEAQAVDTLGTLLVASFGATTVKPFASSPDHASADSSARNALLALAALASAAADTSGAMLAFAYAMKARKMKRVESEELVGCLCAIVRAVHSAMVANLTLRDSLKACNRCRVEISNLEAVHSSAISVVTALSDTVDATGAQFPVIVAGALEGWAFPQFHIVQDDDFAPFFGTSMATPFVAGTVAVLHQLRPQLESRYGALVQALNFGVKSISLSTSPCVLRAVLRQLTARRGTHDQHDGYGALVPDIFRGNLALALFHLAHVWLQAMSQ